MASNWKFGISIYFNFKFKGENLNNVLWCISRLIDWTQWSVLLLINYFMRLWLWFSLFTHWKVMVLVQLTLMQVLIVQPVITVDFNRLYIIRDLVFKSPFFPVCFVDRYLDVYAYDCWWLGLEYRCMINFYF